MQFAISSAAAVKCTLSMQVTVKHWSAPTELVDKIWTVPPERMKAGKKHRVPPSARAGDEMQMEHGGRAAAPCCKMQFI
jgi:hypothetical protein